MLFRNHVNKKYYMFTTDDFFQCFWLVVSWICAWGTWLCKANCILSSKASEVGPHEGVLIHISHFADEKIDPMKQFGKCHRKQLVAPSLIMARSPDTRDALSLTFSAAQCKETDWVLPSRILSTIDSSQEMFLNTDFMNRELIGCFCLSSVRASQKAQDWISGWLVPVMSLSMWVIK